LLAGESQEAYDAMLLRYIDVVQPKDFLGYMFARDLTDQTLDMSRANRHKALSVERKARLWREADAKKAAATRDRREIREQLINAATPQERAAALDLFMTVHHDEILELVDDKHTIDGRAMEAAMDIYERHDRMYGNSFARRRDTIEQFTIYNELLRQQARNIPEPIEGEVIEAEVIEPSTVPALPAEVKND
jgi:hypothetical protein